MAERLEVDRPRRRTFYPWGQWTDGAVWRARLGEDFTCDPHHFQTALHQRARQEGMIVETGTPEPGVVEFVFRKRVPDAAASAHAV